MNTSAETPIAVPNESTVVRISSTGARIDRSSSIRMSMITTQDHRDDQGAVVDRGVVRVDRGGGDAADERIDAVELGAQFADRGCSGVRVGGIRQRSLQQHVAVDDGRLGRRRSRRADRGACRLR